jgi:RNA polymerase sigma-70 factor (ECF subfamily)
VEVLNADPATADDRDLICVLDRDPRAVEEFYRRHVRWLTGALSRAVSDPHDTADLVAATFIAAMESSGRYDPARGDPRAWLYGIARNLLAARWRRAAAESRALDRFGGLRPAAAGTDDFQRADERLDADQLARPAVAALASLPPAERELIEVMLRGDLSVAEAARELGIRTGTARMRLARARHRLTSVLRKEDRP